MDPQEVLSLCKRRGFLWPSFDIYGGMAGMYDFGPLGVTLKNNIENHWRRLYVLQEGFVELMCPLVSPEPVFKASGHLDTFSDMYVECTRCGETYRADHLAKGLHENPATLGEGELGQLLRENGVKCASCRGELTEPKRFNLMFKTMVGAGKAKPGYLRPETAQGMFVNFGQVYRLGREKLPVGAVQVGTSFRNEISPRQGLIRLREFHQMEAELFVDPDDKTWPRFDSVKGERLLLVANTGETKEIALEQAVRDKVIANEVLAYFMWLTHRFALDVGLDPSRMRFRQHERTEMAHYASDCWDLEAELGYGWVELVGVADRGCYDLSAHIKHSDADLTAFQRFDEPREVEHEAVKVRFDVMGKMFKGDTKMVAEALSGMPVGSLKGVEEVTVHAGGRAFQVPSECFEVSMRKEKVTGRKFVPHVIEPAYGVDRILYAVLEHAYSKSAKDGEEYVTLKLKGLVAPFKAGVFPLMARDGLDDVASSIQASLSEAGMHTYYDDAGSIGRRYARMDEVGTPCCITVDYQTKEDGTVTVRDRDSTEQRRIKRENVVQAVARLASGAGLGALDGL
ncbi:MAG: glycine--tRNA ligase [Candidatus Thermoplasmatota archaeon]